MDFILSAIGRLEKEKHSMVLKEILALTGKLYYFQDIFTHISQVWVLDTVGKLFKSQRKKCPISISFISGHKINIGNDGFVIKSLVIAIFTFYHRFREISSPTDEFAPE